MYTRSRIKRSCVRKPITDNSEDEETHLTYNNNNILRKSIYDNNKRSSVGELNVSSKYNNNGSPPSSGNKTFMSAIFIQTSEGLVF